MAEQELKVIGSWISPYVVRVQWVLKMKGIDYEDVEVNLVNKSPILLKNNPVHKKVPVLVHDGKPICESLIIVEYIDETWKENPILPEDPYERAKARFWAKFIDEKLTEPMRRMLFSEGEQLEKETKQTIEALDVLEGELKGKKFFGGDTFGYTDIVLGWITVSLEVIEEVACKKVFDPSKYPCINKWMENFVEIPVVKESLSQRKKIKESQLSPKDTTAQQLQKLLPYWPALAAKK